MKITPWTKVALYEAITRHTMDAAYPTTRIRKGHERATSTSEDPGRRKKAAVNAAGRLTFILAYHDMPRFPA